MHSNNSNTNVMNTPAPKVNIGDDLYVRALAASDDATALVPLLEYGGSIRRAQDGDGYVWIKGGQPGVELVAELNSDTAFNVARGRTLGWTTYKGGTQPWAGVRADLRDLADDDWRGLGRVQAVILSMLHENAIKHDARHYRVERKALAIS